MKSVTLVTGNHDKAKQVADWLGTHIPHQKIDLDELQSMDIREIVGHKARRAYDILKAPVLVEDVSLTFKALGQLPGPFIKWFIEELGYDRLARLLEGYDDRSAHAVICYALFDGKDIHFFEGEMRGHIAPGPRGTGGFGFDPIFVNKGYEITRAEMSLEDYAATSYRKQALDKLKDFLKDG